MGGEHACQTAAAGWEGCMDESVPGLQWRTETNADLLCFMSMRENEPHAAREAWKEFYGRHVEYLYKVCRRRFSRSVGGEQGVLDLVQETFRQVFERAGDFVDDCKADPEKGIWRVRGWLGTIARNLMVADWRDRRKLNAQFIEQQDWQEVRTPIPVLAASEAQQCRKELVEAALKSLSTKEQDVLLDTIFYYRVDRIHQRLPSGKAAELAARHGTTPENVRTIRKRALEKIADYVKRHEPGH
jgi:RNA polymerase sigma factor (sigma-70 family)